MWSIERGMEREVEVLWLGFVGSWALGWGIVVVAAGWWVCRKVHF